jgi:signal peptidase I
VVFVRELFVVVVGALVVAALVRAFVGQTFVIPSSSMENTLQVANRVAVEKLSTVKRGQIVVFEDPGGWLAPGTQVERGPVGRFAEFVGVLPDTGTNHLVKRVIGLPGDQVVCCDADGQITVNQRPLVESGYLYANPATAEQVKPSEIRFDVVVPADRIFVLGDRRDNSRDARCHLNDEVAGGVPGENAFVPEKAVVGRAFAVLWPVSDARLFEVPAAFAEVPPGKRPPPAEPEITAGQEARC